MCKMYNSNGMSELQKLVKWATMLAEGVKEICCRVFTETKSNDGLIYIKHDWFSLLFIVKPFIWHYSQELGKLHHVIPCFFTILLRLK